MEANTTFTKAVHDLLYHPLNSEIREIRVMRIERSEPDESDIHCSLETVSLNTDPVYQALSYEWGPRDEGEPESRVLLNGHPVVTTPNLRLALRHLEAGPCYWIDALCIDQSNDQERGHQVRLMTDIYGKASAVLAWLGPEEGDSAKGLEQLDEIEAMIAETEGFVDSSDRLRNLLENSLQDEARRVYWNGLERIFQRTYWTRLWIIQELVVSKDRYEVWLLCGLSKARFASLEALKSHLDASSKKISGLYPQGSVDDFMMRLRRSGRKALNIAGHVMTLRSDSTEAERNASTLNIVRVYRTQLCADPRDKIYALLGVSLHYPHLEFPITYTTPVLDVYKKFAQYEIAGSKTLNVLSCAGYDQYNFSARPSWVPDWQIKERHRMIRPLWQSSRRMSSIFTYSVDNNILLTRGFIIGPIISLFETRKSLPATGTSFSEITKFYSNESQVKPSIAFDNYRKELNSWLCFIKNARQDPTQNTASSITNMKIVYELLLFLDVKPTRAEREVPLAKFYGLCGSAETVTLVEDVTAVEEERLFDRIMYRMRRPRQLCSIHVAPSAHSADNQDLSGAANGGGETAIGICSLNARIGDVVTVIRGCMYPMLLRKVEDGMRYEVIGVIYVCGFMNGEALDRFEEVDIDLV